MHIPQDAPSHSLMHSRLPALAGARQAAPRSPHRGGRQVLPGTPKQAAQPPGARTDRGGGGLSMTTAPAAGHAPGCAWGAAHELQLLRCHESKWRLPPHDAGEMAPQLARPQNNLLPAAALACTSVLCTQQCVRGCGCGARGGVCILSATAVAEGAAGAPAFLFLGAFARNSRSDASASKL